MPIIDSIVLQSAAAASIKYDEGAECVLLKKTQDEIGKSRGQTHL